MKNPRSSAKAGVSFVRSRKIRVQQSAWAWPTLIWLMIGTAVVIGVFSGHIQKAKDPAAKGKL